MNAQSRSSQSMGSRLNVQTIQFLGDRSWICTRNTCSSRYKDCHRSTTFVNETRACSKVNSAEDRHSLCKCEASQPPDNNVICRPHQKHGAAADRILNNVSSGRAPAVPTTTDITPLPLCHRNPFELFSIVYPSGLQEKMRFHGQRNERI